jgi:hypothetical protein
MGSSKIMSCILNKSCRMEGTPLYETLKSLEKPNPLESFFGDFQTVNVVIHDGQSEETIELTNVAPFFTLDDLQRSLWLDQEEPDHLFPKFTYWAYEKDGELLPATSVYVSEIETQVKILPVPDPRTVIPTGQHLEEFVDDSGKKRPFGERPRGRSTLEDIFLKKSEDEFPTFHCFSYRGLLASYQGVQPISELDWYGLFYPYFPRLERGSNGIMTTNDVEQKSVIRVYIEAKRTQVGFLETLLAENYDDLREIRAVNARLFTLQWTNLHQEETFQGVDTLFFSSPVSTVRPYMRLMSPNTTAITKLYQPDPMEPPVVNDPILLQTWSRDTNPLAGQNMLTIKGLLRGGLKPFYGTLQVFDDTTAVFTAQPSAQDRVIEFSSDLARLADVLPEITKDMPFKLQDAKLGRLAITFELRTESTPYNFTKQIAKRFSTLNTLFQPITPLEKDVKSFLSYRYKGVSNFTRESRIFSYLNYIFSRGKLDQDNLSKVVEQLIREFQISEEDAKTYLSEYTKDATNVTTIDDDARDYLVVNNPGIDFSIYSYAVDTYRIQFYNVRAITIQDLLRVTTTLALVFYGSEESWEEGFVDEKQIQRTDKAAAFVERQDLEEDQEAMRSTAAAPQEIGGIDAESGANYEDLMNYAEYGVEEEEEVDGTPSTAAAAANTIMENKNTKSSKKVEPEEEIPGGKIVMDKWFIKHLQKLDPVLFDYTVQKEKGEKAYSTQCANNDDRYPIGLTESQYQTMRQKYQKAEAENRVAFLVYGTPQTKKMLEQAKLKKNKLITLLRYGSDPSNPHYYLCAGIICLRDILPVLKEDFESTKDWNENPKPKNSCPFCHGTEIKDRKAPKEGETVFVRRLKQNGKAAHTWIRFLKDAKHPEEYHLPCCFVDDPVLEEKKPFESKKVQTMDWDNAAFESFRKATSPLEVAAPAPEAPEADSYYPKDFKDYDVFRYLISTQYILGPEKYPLDPGKIGIPSPSLDAFFGQDSSKLVWRPKIASEFKKNAKGFFRVGVLNRKSTSNMSLFAALAPLLGFSKPDAVARHFIDKITPRVFLNLNFGNLLLEFFNPSDAEPDDTTLANWARTHLLIYQPTPKTGGFVREELSRFYRSYHRFIRYIQDPKQKKQLRHFVHALAEPPKNTDEIGLLTPQGLTIMVLHYKGDPRSDKTQVEVLCPLMGFDVHRYNQNAVGFLTYSNQGFWEPLMYVNLKQTSSSFPTAYYTITQKQFIEPGFPVVVRDRYVKEYLVRCRSAFRGAFTLQSKVDNRVLLPVSKIFEILKGYVITGLVKDAYNHLVAITMRPLTAGNTGEVLVPTIDDGNSFHYNTALKIYIGLKAIDFASANDVYELYTRVISPLLLPLSELYQITEFKANSKGIYGFYLGSMEGFARVLLPSKSEESEGMEIPEDLIETSTVDDYEFEYTITREIVFSTNQDTWGENEGDESTYLLQRKQVEQLYENLRLSFSNWIATVASPSLRKEIEKLVMTQPWLNQPLLTNREKFYRLKILLGSTLQSWLEAEGQGGDTQNVLVRSDCIAIEDGGDERCSGACKQVNGQCKIHIPEEVRVRSSPSLKSISATEYFVNRLLDEIVRLPARRHELMTESVRRLQIPSKNIHIGPEWILPENTIAWYELLREKEVRGVEKPEFYEEMSRQTVTEKEMEDLTIVTHLASLPEQVATMIQEKYRNLLAVRVFNNVEDSQRTNVLMNYFGISSVSEFCKNNKEDTFDDKCMAYISKQQQIPVIQILTRMSPPIVTGRLDILTFRSKNAAYVILPDLADGPGFLILKDDIEDTIPGEILSGPIFESILETRVAKRPVLIRKKPENAQAAAAATTPS